jgi:putative radical SAM enzyme (TIGR03279 family)
LLTISSVKTPSPASAAGFRRGDLLISCNGHPMVDWVDFLFLASGASIDLRYQRGGLRRGRSIRRNPGADWGFTFKGQEPRACRRRCIFCFVDQLPPGVRPSLLLKDDDIRYSFIQGTYVTLHHGDVEYALRKRLSPLHISVHSTEPGLRGRMLGTGHDEPIMDSLLALSEAGTVIETQIVIVPGYNDGARLERTVEDLFSIPGISSVGVVPVGLTRHREGLPSIRRPTGAEAWRIIGLCHEWRDRASKKGRGGWIFPSDELFLMAGMDIPSPDYYSTCTLRENGIGMLSELSAFEGKSFCGSGLVCTGELAAPYIKKILEGGGYIVAAVENHFLGRQVGVAGLLSGTDVIRTVREFSDAYNRVILPSVMFNHDMLTIDDLSPDDLSRLTGRKVLIIDGLEELD